MDQHLLTLFVLIQKLNSFHWFKCNYGDRFQNFHFVCVLACFQHDPDCFLDLAKLAQQRNLEDDTEV